MTSSNDPDDAHAMEQHDTPDSPFQHFRPFRQSRHDGSRPGRPRALSPLEPDPGRGAGSPGADGKPRPQALDERSDGGDAGDRGDLGYLGDLAGPDDSAGPADRRRPDGLGGLNELGGLSGRSGPDESDETSGSGGTHGSGGTGGPSGADGRAEPAGGGPGEILDEELLRTLMRSAVQGIEGSPHALDHLRRAIPARRQHRRQALAGAVAAVLLAGMAIPALLRATDATHSDGAASQNVASSHAAAPGEDGHTSTWSGSDGPPGRTSTAPGAGPSKPQPSVGPGIPTAVISSPSQSETPVVPACSSAQLGQGTGQAGTPDADGRVYGWFRLTNISTAACTVPGPGLVHAAAMGSADSSRIQVVDHSTGDPATGLPPANGGSPFVLNPGEDYEVDFAWVPAADGPGGCPAPSSPPASPPPTPTPTDSSSPAADAGVAPDANSPQSGPDTPTSMPPGSVALSHTPAAGAPVVTGPVIKNACAGTVYTTPARLAPTSTPAPGS